jgi:hypothetical protein
MKYKTNLFVFPEGRYCSTYIKISAEQKLMADIIIYKNTVLVFPAAEKYILL